MRNPFSRSKCVMGIFDTRHDVECVVDRLKSNGFSSSDISVLIPDWRSSMSLSYYTKLTDVANGARTGVLLGGTLGWLVGVGSFAVPGIGPLIAAGPVISFFAGAGLGGAVGAIKGAFKRLGISEDEAKKYESCLQDGGLFVSTQVLNEHWAERAKKILREENGRDISMTGEGKEEISAFHLPGYYSQPLF